MLRVLIVSTCLLAAACKTTNDAASVKDDDASACILLDTPQGTPLNCDEGVAAGDCASRTATPPEMWLPVAGCDCTQCDLPPTLDTFDLSGAPPSDGGTQGFAGDGPGPSDAAEGGQHGLSCTGTYNGAKKVMLTALVVDQSTIDDVSYLGRKGRGPIAGDGKSVPAPFTKAAADGASPLIRPSDGYLHYLVRYNKTTLDLWLPSGLKRQSGTFAGADIFFADEDVLNDVLTCQVN